MLANPYVILGALCAWLLSTAATGWLMYNRGSDDQRNAQTVQQLAQANANIESMKRKDAAAALAGEKHDEHIHTVQNTTREIVRTVTIPPAADPFLPVGFVRLFDRAASRQLGADPYPGKSDGDPSDVKVSEAAGLLADNFGEAEACRVQLTDLISYLKADRTPAPNPSLFEHLNPF